MKSNRLKIELIILVISIFALIVTLIRTDNIPEPLDKIWQKTLSFTDSLKIPQPTSGDILQAADDYDNTQQNCGILHIESKCSKDACLKIKDCDTNEVVLIGYVRANESADYMIPYGTVELSFAYGDHWLGLDHLFGIRTQYSETESRKIDFSETKNWSVSIYESMLHGHRYRVPQFLF